VIECAGKMYSCFTCHPLRITNWLQYYKHGPMLFL
jgi:hypothetical protein